MRVVWLGALVVALAGCATMERHVTVWQAADPGGVYPSGPLSGEPAYFVGWHVYH
ncbi:MAG: hypothetical protein U1E60_00190 [Reyranellaceae bacterium]